MNAAVNKHLLLSIIYRICVDVPFLRGMCVRYMGCGRVTRRTSGHVCAFLSVGRIAHALLFLLSRDFA